MAFYQKLALNATTLAAAQNGLALSDSGRRLHGFFVNQADSVGTTLTTGIEIWAKNPSGTYVQIVSQADPDTNEWISAIGSGVGDFQKYIQLGDVNTTGIPSTAHFLQLPTSANWRIRINPTNGTADDSMVVVALLSDGLG